MTRWWWPRRRRRPAARESGEADIHLETLRRQRAHVERLADRLDASKGNNNFRLRVEQALRGQS